MIYRTTLLSGYNKKYASGHDGEYGSYESGGYGSHTKGDEYGRAHDDVSVEYLTDANCPVTGLQRRIRPLGTPRRCVLRRRELRKWW